MPLSVIPLPGMPPTTVVSVVSTGQSGKISTGQTGETSIEPSGKTSTGHSGGSDTNTMNVTGEHLMKVFTRMLEILNEKKNEKNN